MEKIEETVVYNAHTYERKIELVGWQMIWILNSCSTKILDGDDKWCLDASKVVDGLLLPFSVLQQLAQANDQKTHFSPLKPWIPPGRFFPSTRKVY